MQKGNEMEQSIWEVFMNEGKKLGKTNEEIGKALAAVLFAETRQVDTETVNNIPEQISIPEVQSEPDNVTPNTARQTRISTKGIAITMENKGGLRLSHSSLSEAGKAIGRSETYIGVNLRKGMPIYSKVNGHRGEEWFVVNKEEVLSKLASGHSIKAQPKTLRDAMGRNYTFKSVTDAETFLGRGHGYIKMNIERGLPITNWKGERFYLVEDNK